MRQKEKAKNLSFVSKDKKNSKRFKSFIVAFVAFVLLLGSVSALMFMKSIDFDLKNLVSSAETTTEQVTETTTAPVALNGSSNILLAVRNIDSKITVAFVISTDFTSKTINIRAINDNLENYSGVLALRDAVSSSLNINIDRYIYTSESSFKEFLGKLGDITVNLPASVNDKNLGLILNEGAQSLSSDLFYKYLLYAEPVNKSQAMGEMAKTLLSEKYINSFEKLFSYTANNSQTDITIVDFTKEKDKLQQLATMEITVVAQ